MVIKVMDRRSSAQFAQVINTNIPTSKEVVMSKVNAIVVKQVSTSPKMKSIGLSKEVAPVEKMYTMTQVKEMIALALEARRTKGTYRTAEPVESDLKWTRGRESRKEVIKVQAQSEEVAPIKVKADMHAAGVKAYATRIHNQQGHVFVEVAKKYQPGQTFTITVDSGLPTVKTLRCKYDSVSGRLHSFRVKVEKRAGKADYSFYYLPIAIQL